MQALHTITRSCALSVVIPVYNEETGLDALVARVVDLNWRTTRVQDRNGDLIVIPNAQLANTYDTAIRRLPLNCPRGRKRMSGWSDPHRLPTE